MPVCSAGKRLHINVSCTQRERRKAIDELNCICTPSSLSTPAATAALLVQFDVAAVLKVLVATVYVGQVPVVAVTRLVIGCSVTTSCAA